MARNAAWRGSVATWRERVRDWVSARNPDDLLSVDIFFDLRGVHGESGMANALWEDAFDAAKGRADFAKLLAETAGKSERGLNWFGGFKTDQGRIDLKKAGLFGICQRGARLGDPPQRARTLNARAAHGRQGAWASAPKAISTRFAMPKKCFSISSLPSRSRTSPPAGPPTTRLWLRVFRRATGNGCARRFRPSPRWRI